MAESVERCRSPAGDGGSLSWPAMTCTGTDTGTGIRRRPRGVVLSAPATRHLSSPAPPRAQPGGGSAHPTHRLSLAVEGGRPPLQGGIELPVLLLTSQEALRPIRCGARGTGGRARSALFACRCRPRGRACASRGWVSGPPRGQATEAENKRAGAHLGEGPLDLAARAPLSWRAGVP